MNKKKEPLATIWEIDDALWELIQPVLMRSWPPKRTGRPPADWRKVMNGIMYRLRTGCQWKIVCPSSSATTPRCIAGFSAGLRTA